MKKNILIIININLIFLTLAACNNGSIMANLSDNQSSPNIANGGLNINNLPTGSDIKSLAKATVGLILDDGIFTKKICSGVAIQDNLLVTAGHCVLGIKNNKITLNFTNGQKQNVTYTKYNTEYTKDMFDKKETDKGQDIAIIKFPAETFQDFVPHNKIISSFDNYGDFRVIENLRDVFSQKDSTLYVGGYSTKELLFGRTLINIGDVSRIMFPNQDKSTPTYNINVGKYMVFPSEPSGGGGWNNITTNILYSSMTNKFVIKQLAFLTEGGDSGGPYFVCKNVQNNCYLVAVHNSSINGGSNGATTIANPFATIAYQMLK